MPVPCGSRGPPLVQNVAHLSQCTWNPSSPNSPATVSKSLRRNRRVSQRSSSAKQVPRWGLEFADTGSKEG